MIHKYKDFNDIYHRQKILQTVTDIGPFETTKSCLIYYGVSGHGKGLVDAMSRFGVKGAIGRVVNYKTSSLITLLKTFSTFQSYLKMMTKNNTSFF